jgi:pyruvate dehydrogenase E2 component (dihydrolipoamide acetyltransferase)
MITKVVMPKLSDAMETGKVIQWMKKEGDKIKGGDILAEIETDKANVEIEAFGSGVLRKIVVTPGGQVPVGELIGIIADPDEDISSTAASAPKSTPSPAAQPAAPPVPPPAAAIPAMETYQSVPATSRVVPAVPVATAPAMPASAGARVKASPLARKVAGQAGVDLRLIQGTGPGGRIVRRDVEAAAAAPAPSAPTTPRAPAPAPAAAGRPAFVIPPRAEAEYEDQPLLSYPRRDREANAALKGAGAPLLRHGRGGHGPRVGSSRGVECARRPAEAVCE